MTNTDLYYYVSLRIFELDDDIEKLKEIEKYIKETFIPSVDEILHQIINLYNITLAMESCVIYSKYFGFGNRKILTVSDTFMEDYIYRFIEFKNKINEYVEIYKNCDGSKYFNPFIKWIFNIQYNDEGNYIVMNSYVNGYEFYCIIAVEEKFRYLKDIFQSD